MEKSAEVAKLEAAKAGKPGQAPIKGELTLAELINVVGGFPASPIVNGRYGGTNKTRFGQQPQCLC